MKLLLDSCVWGGTKIFLKDVGYDVIWIGDYQNDPGDEEIIDQAYRENRVLITLDKDFGDLAIFKNKPHAGIIRIVNHRVKQQGKACLGVLKKYANDINKGAIITVTKDRIRIRLD